MNAEALAGIDRVFAAFRGGDPRALVEVIGADATWIVNGTVPVAQAYVGRARIFELFRETRRLTGGSYLSTLRWSLADDVHAVAVYRAQGTRLGRELDIDQVLLIAHEGGVWRHITAIPSDPPAFEAFWA
ncbi:MAG TPA: nuclear transport factor 2 family protein [Gaiellaceae bacterium]|nr:nuclear transport factor 2 family protein [Gaiellaceae bacterium]